MVTWVCDFGLSITYLPNSKWDTTSVKGPKLFLVGHQSHQRFNWGKMSASGLVDSSLLVVRVWRESVKALNFKMAWKTWRQAIERGGRKMMERGKTAGGQSREKRKGRRTVIPTLQLKCRLSPLIPVHYLLGIRSVFRPCPLLEAQMQLANWLIKQFHG